MGFVRCMGYSDADLEDSKTVTSNGIILPSEGYIGMKQVEVNVNQALEPLTVSSNGIYTPGAGVIGFNSVAVNVPISTGSSIGKVTIQDYANSQVSTNVTIPNRENLIIESYYNIINTVNPYNWANVQVRIDVCRGLETLYTDTFSVNNHIGYSTGSGNLGYIPPIDVEANDEITVKLRMDLANSNHFADIVFLIYY